MIRRLARLAATFSLAVAASAQAQGGPVVHAPAGVVEGLSEGASNVFKGLPYAEPPVGPLRWTSPKPARTWSGVRPAKDFGAACVQPTGGPPNLYTDPLPRTGEDCLFLNIWAPKDARNAPVFFWIHGGALLSGASSEGVYEGAKLAAKGVVVVSINYRLGVLGYLAHPGLSAESPEGLSGNYGLLDQIEALRWVKRNVAAFGGDPANVTIAGESAGALSVMYLMTSPPARGLFAKAVSESGYMISTPELKKAAYGAPSAEDAGTALGTKLGAPNVTALRAMDAQTITNAAAKAGYGPFGAVDGHILPSQLVEVFERGEQARVPLLVGFNSGEIRSLPMLAPRAPASAADYEKTIHSQYGDLSGAFLKEYPPTNLEESVIATTRDALYGWTAERMAKTQAAIGELTYLYLFDHGYPAMDERHLHGFHASELPFVFGTAQKLPANWPRPPATAQETAFSDAMTDYWTSFARTGKPVAAGEPVWPAYGASGGYMHFAATPQPAAHVLPGMYALEEQVVCRRRADGRQGWNWNVGLWSPPLPPNAPGCS